MRVWMGMCVKKCFHPFAYGSNFAQVSMKLCQGAYFKDDRNFWTFIDPLPSSERKMTSLLLILTTFCRYPPPTLRSSFKYPPLDSIQPSSAYICVYVTRDAAKNGQRQHSTKKTCFCFFTSMFLLSQACMAKSMSLICLGPTLCRTITNCRANHYQQTDASQLEGAGPHRDLEKKFSTFFGPDPEVS